MYLPDGKQDTFEGYICQLLKGHDQSLRESENRIREQFRENLKETLSAKGQKRWTLLEDLALEHGYAVEDGYSYQYDNNYLMRIAWNIIYVENITTQAYKELRELLERKGKIKTSPSLIGNALTIGSSTLGGAFLGYLLIRAGLHPLVLIPSIVIPPSVCIYDMLKQTTKESNKLARIDTFLEKYQDNRLRNQQVTFHYDVALWLQSLLPGTVDSSPSHQRAPKKEKIFSLGGTTLRLVRIRSCVAVWALVLGLVVFTCSELLAETEENE